MLVLTRKAGETIRIGNDVVIKVVQTGRGSVRLGIEAPAEMRILRGELLEWPTERRATLDAAEAIDLECGDRPFVAEACVEPAVHKTRFQSEEEPLPGRSIRRILNSYRTSLAASAK